MPTFSLTQYQQVQNIQNLLFQLMQETPMQANPQISAALLTAYTNLTTIATVIADLGAN